MTNIQATDGVHDYDLPFKRARVLYTSLHYALVDMLKREQVDACLAQRRQWERDADTGMGCGT